MEAPGALRTSPPSVNGAVHEEQNPLMERNNGAMLKGTHRQSSLERTACFHIMPTNICCGAIWLCVSHKRLQETVLPSRNSKNLWE